MTSTSGLTADESEILEALEPGASTAGELARACELSRNRVVFCASRLIMLGLVHIGTVNKRVVYQLTEQGRQGLATT